VTSTQNKVPNKKAAITNGAKLLDSPEKLGNFCKSTGGAITFMELNSYKAKFGKAISVEGVKPDVSSVISGAYPMAVTYYLVSDGSADVVPLEKFIQSEAGKTIINKNFVAVE